MKMRRNFRRFFYRKVRFENGFHAHLWEELADSAGDPALQWVTGRAAASSQAPPKRTFTILPSMVTSSTEPLWYVTR